MPQRVQTVGRVGVSFVDRLGGLSLLFFRFLLSLKAVPQSFRLIIEQVYSLGVKSLSVIVTISLFVGAVSAWQAAYQFKFIGAPMSMLGNAVGKAVVIELAPVLSGLVFAGRVGAGIAAELGTMRVTEQIDALEAMGIKPIRYLAMPRILACVIMLPLLVVFANFVAILGGAMTSMLGAELSWETFMFGFRDSFELSDFLGGLSKAAVFGLVVGLVGCYEGFRTEEGAVGVGRATTSSVVTSTVLILIMNFLFALLLFRI